MEFSQIIHAQNVNVPKEYENILKKHLGIRYVSLELLKSTVAVRAGMQQINLNT